MSEYLVNIQVTSYYKLQIGLEIALFFRSISTLWCKQKSYFFSDIQKNCIFII